MAAAEADRDYADDVEDANATFRLAAGDLAATRANAFFDTRVTVFYGVDPGIYAAAAGVERLAIIAAILPLSVARPGKVGDAQIAWQGQIGAAEIALDGALADAKIAYVNTLAGANDDYVAARRSRSTFGRNTSSRWKPPRRPIFPWPTWPPPTTAGKSRRPTAAAAKREIAYARAGALAEADYFAALADSSADQAEAVWNNGSGTPQQHFNAVYARANANWLTGLRTEYGDYAESLATASQAYSQTLRTAD